VKMEPGIYEDLPFKDYLKVDAISKSALFGIERCEHYYQHQQAERAKQDASDEPEKEHFILGRAIHTAALEPDLFDSQYTVAPVINRRTNAGKEAWANFQADAALAGINVLTAEQYEQVRGMGESVINHPAAQDILSRGKAEVSIFNHDKKYGVDRKCRIDWWVDDDIIVDLKSTGRMASEHAVLMQIFDLGYYMQAGMYLDIASDSMNKRLTEFMFLFVESKPPHTVGIYRLSDKDCSLGKAKYMELMDKYKRALDTGEWPHYNDNQIVGAELLPWMRTKISRNMDEIF